MILVKILIVIMLGGMWGASMAHFVGGGLGVFLTVVGSSIIGFGLAPWVWK